MKCCFAYVSKLFCCCSCQKNLQDDEKKFPSFFFFLICEMVLSGNNNMKGEKGKGKKLRISQKKRFLFCHCCENRIENHFFTIIENCFRIQSYKEISSKFQYGALPQFDNLIS